MKIWTYTVSGTSKFPFDMLRYDQCWPADQDQSVRVSLELTPTPPLTVKLVGTRPPTTERWKSFGWTVLDPGVKPHTVPQ